MMLWILLLCGLDLVQSKASEYSLESESRCATLRSVAFAEQKDHIPQCTGDGRFRNTQCSSGGQQCWCVGAEGHEVAGTRSNNSAPNCLPPCMLLRHQVLRTPGSGSSPQCQAATGDFEVVQCDSSSERCWCVDLQGMELYGTRQNGRPQRCPGSCAVRMRRLLHASRGSSHPPPPPQCDEEHSFLPVQCKLINNGTELNLEQQDRTLLSFSRISSLFPFVSAFCFCSTRQGRELENTGVELRLSGVYDSAFSDLRPPRSFSQSNMYRVLQRRLLALRLAATGHFRCPTSCEVERQEALETSGVFVPSCEADGSFSTRQCQQGGQCWCVDPQGTELPGTRRLRNPPSCGSFAADCRSRRRWALSRMLSGPLDPPSHTSSSSEPCSSLLRPLQSLPQGEEPLAFLSRLAEVLQGLFPSVGHALQALGRSSAARLQENLFGGKFLNNVAAFNFTGAVGERGTFPLPDQNLALNLGQGQNQKLMQSVIWALQNPLFLSALKHTLQSNTHSANMEQVLGGLVRFCRFDQVDWAPSCTPSGQYQEVQCTGRGCWCVDTWGHEIAGSRSTSGRPRCPSRCERERARAIKEKSNMAAGADVHVPACTAAGDFLQVQCEGRGCFCVGKDGNRTNFSCRAVLDEVIAFQQEVDRMASHSDPSHFLGLGFLLAHGLRLTPEELSRGPSPAGAVVSEQLLSHSHAALRLAASSVAGRSQIYVPQCDARGNWQQAQCHLGTGQCWCVDPEGQYVPDSLTSRSLTTLKCPSPCQEARTRTLLSGWTTGSDITSFSSLQCKQTGGTTESCVSLSGMSLQPTTPSHTGETCPSLCVLLGLQCLRDGSISPLQCDITSCWCVFKDGQEVLGSRTLRHGARQSCDRPRCPNADVTHGALLCHITTAGRQSCQLSCHHGYQNVLPVSSFLCEVTSQHWESSKPLAGACQRPQSFQTVHTTAQWTLPVSEVASFLSPKPRLQTDILNNMAARGLCSFQLPSGHSVALCDDSLLRLDGDGDIVRLKVTWTALLSEVPASDLADLRDVDILLNGTRLVDGVQRILGNFSSDPQLISMTTPSLGCYHGYHLDTERKGCVVCPAGSSSSEGECLLCPEGTYQDTEGQSSCATCPRGSSAIGASSVNQCHTECQRAGLRCSADGDFLLAQPDFLSGGWRCVSPKGAELEWTNSKDPLSDDDCRELSSFEVVPVSALITTEEEKAEVLLTTTSEITSCVRACALQSSCHHVAVFTVNGLRQCELYSTHTLNTHCKAPMQARGFLGNSQAERFAEFRCFLKVNVKTNNLLVVRKKGEEAAALGSFRRMRMTKAPSGVFRVLVFPGGTALSDVHRLCQESCVQEACCRGFTLTHNRLDGGSSLCGLMGAPSVLMCSDQDWDVMGLGVASRVCGAGLEYDEEQRSFIYNFGGQEFTIDDSALPSDAKNKKNYAASIVTFQRIYLNTDSVVVGSSCTVEPQHPLLDTSVRGRFDSLSSSRILVDPNQTVPVLTFWLNKQDYDSHNALLWCLARCEEEQHCYLVDIREDDDASFFSCFLFPDTTVCGAYDKEERRPCRPLLARSSNSTYQKRVHVSGPVQSFYNRVPFQKMVSYSVRNRIAMGDGALTEGFYQCERRCDADPCCRGFGLVRDATTPGGSEVMCLLLISLGIQTCSEEATGAWMTQDCGPGPVQTTPNPLGWYLKPVNQWTDAPSLCPAFSLPATNSSVERWYVLDPSSVQLHPSLSSYDVVHVSRDAADVGGARDWCLHACQQVASCAALSISQTEAAIRCVFYPDTRACGLNSSPRATSPASSCRLLVREPADQVYLRTERLPVAPTVLIPGHGTLQGVTVETPLGADRKLVVQFLGVPFARPPIGSLRFRAPEPENWTGTWDATRPRASCLQPGDEDSWYSDEDCLYLNVFVPAGLMGRVPVLVYFFNPSANQSTGLLDGSTLAAVGNIVVVTANYRTAALGFLRAASAGFHGNYGLLDQQAALHWVLSHAALVGGDSSRVTVGAERRGADIASLHLLSSSSSPPLFQRMILMGGSVFSPSLLSSPSSARHHFLELVAELGCVTSDPRNHNQEEKMAACLQQSPAHTLNVAQTKILAVSGPFKSWSPVLAGVSQSQFHKVDLLMGTSAGDSLISRARRIKEVEALRGRAESRTAFYQALSRSVGGENSSSLVTEAVEWFYALEHSADPAGYNHFSQALENATRDQFIVCPSLQMARHWASSNANVFRYHLPASGLQHSADVDVSLDVQLLFGTPHRPISRPRFSAAARRLSLAVMSYMSNFIKTGDPNQVLRGSRPGPGGALPLWLPVLPSPAPSHYMELDPDLRQRQGLQDVQCSFWTKLVPHLRAWTAELGAEPVPPALTPDLPIRRPSDQSQTKKDGYS